MYRVRGIVLAMMVALLATTMTLAQDPKKDEPKGRPERPGRVELQPGQFPQLPQLSLLSKEAVEKLKLTDEQHKKFEKIESEYKDKLKEMADKITEALQGGDVDKIREAVQNRAADTRELRTDYLTKIEGLLTDEQKKLFEEIKKEQPRLIPPGGGGIGGGRPGRPTTPPVGDVLSKPAQERLKLTEEQKKQVEALQKDLETKLQQILTDEQKKQLEELKKETPPTPPNPRRPGGDGR